MESTSPSLAGGTVKIALARASRFCRADVPIASTMVSSVSPTEASPKCHTKPGTKARHLTGCLIGISLMRPKQPINIDAEGYGGVVFDHDTSGFGTEMPM